MATQGGLTGTGQVGDPCLNEFYGCTGTIPVASQFIPSPYDPRTVQGSDGCKFFNGCYIVVNGQYLRWVNGFVGYMPVTPTPDQSPAQLYQQLNPQTVPANPRLSNPAYKGTDTIVQNGQTLYWSDVFNGYTSNTPQQLAASGNPNVLPSGGLAGQTNINAGPNQLVESAYALTQPINVNVDTSAIAGAVDRFISEGQALQAQNQQIISKLVDLNSGPNKLVSSAYVPPAPVTVSVDTKPIADSVDRFISEGQAAQAEQVKQFADGFGQLQTSQAEQVKATEAQTGAIDKATTAFNLLNDILQGKTGNILGDVLGGAWSNLGPELIQRLNAYKAIFDALLSGQYKSWDDMQHALEQVSSLNDITFLAIDVMGVISLFVRLGIIRLDPIATELSQLAQASNPLKTLDPASVQEVYKRGLWTASDSADELAKQGLNAERSRLFLALSEQLLDYGLLEQAYHREFMTPEDVSTALSQLGYSAENASVIAQLYNHIPTPQDLTRIADKRVWGNVTDPKYGQYAELSDEYVRLMGQWGYSEETTRLLWASHWNLPSPQQVFEMFHRGQISQDDIEVYLGLTDWLPYFRDGLLAISYNPLGRIDIKRAHNAGILDSETAQQKYQELGYSPENAAIMVEISKQTGTDTDQHLLTQIRDRARTAIERAYVKGTIDRNEATQHLLALGIDAPTVNALLALLDHEIQASSATTRRETHTTKAINAVIHAFSKGSLPYDDAQGFLEQLGLSSQDAINELLFAEIERLAALKGEWANHAVAMFAAHNIDYAGFTAMLAEHGFSATEIGQLEQEADMKRQQRVHKLTEAQYASAFKKQYINEAEFEDHLRGLGYADDSVALLVRLAGG